jgi:hypothetical protein
MEYVADVLDLANGAHQYGDADATDGDEINETDRDAAGTPSISQLSHVIAQAAAPPFMPG